MVPAEVAGDYQPVHGVTALVGEQTVGPTVPLWSVPDLAADPFDSSGRFRVDPGPAVGSGLGTGVMLAERPRRKAPARSLTVHFSATVHGVLVAGSGSYDPLVCVVSFVVRRGQRKPA